MFRCTIRSVATGGYDRKITNGKTLLKMIDYLRNNPLRRGSVERAVDWKRPTISAGASWEGRSSQSTNSENIFRLAMRFRPVFFLAGACLLACDVECGWV